MKLFGRRWGVNQKGREEFRKQLAEVDAHGWDDPQGACAWMERSREAMGDSAVPFAVGEAISRLHTYARGLCTDDRLLDQSIELLVMARMYTRAVPSEVAQGGEQHEELRKQGRQEGLGNVAPQHAARNARPDEAGDEDLEAGRQAVVSEGQVTQAAQ